MSFCRTGCLLIVACALLCSPGWAQDDLGITVTGSGEVMAKPDALEINLQMVGSAELTADAMTKYRDAQERTLEAFQKLGMQNLKVIRNGLGINSGDMNAAIARRQGGQGNVKSEMDIAGDVRLVLSGVDSMTEEQVTEAVSRLLDTAKDAGSLISGNQANAMIARIYGQQMTSSAVTFVVQNIESSREKASTAAFEQARGRAEQLAKLAGATLGPVIALQETLEPQSASENSRMSRMMAMVYGNMLESGESKDRRVTSEKLCEVPIRVSLKVRFGLNPGKGPAR